MTKQGIVPLVAVVSVFASVALAGWSARKPAQGVPAGAAEKPSAQRGQVVAPRHGAAVAGSGGAVRLGGVSRAEQAGGDASLPVRAWVGGDYLVEPGPHVTFRAPVALVTGGESLGAVVAGDVTGDGRVDIAVGLDWNGYDGQVAGLFEQLPGGGFAPFRVLTAHYSGFYPGLAMIHADADDVPEIVAGHGMGLTVFEQPVNGATTLAMIEEEQIYLAPVDINNDGRADIVAFGRHHGGSMFVSDPERGVLYAGQIDDEHRFGDAVEVVDMTGDGRDDIVLLQRSEDRVVIFPAKSTFGLDAPIPVPTGEFYGSGMTVGDFNGDGRKDIVISQARNPPNAKLGFFYGQAGGGFSSVHEMEVQDSPEVLVTADLDRNGMDDLVIGRGGGFPVSVLLQGANGFIPEAQLPPVEELRAWGGVRSDGLQVADVDGNGCLDVLLAHASNDLAVWYGETCAPPPASGKPRPGAGRP
jgi:hypothetical protein